MRGQKAHLDKTSIFVRKLDFRKFNEFSQIFQKVKHFNLHAEKSDKMAQNHIFIQIEFKDKNWIFAPVCIVVRTYQFSSFLFLGFLLPTLMNIRFKARDGVATDDIFRIEHLHQIIDVRCG